MKLWHHKFSDNQIEVKHNAEPLRTNDKSKMSYLLHQFLIWISILSILFLIINFLKTNINLINI